MLIKNYLPIWFNEEFKERMERLKLKEDEAIIKNFLKLIYLHFIQPAKFVIQISKNLSKIDKNIEAAIIILPIGKILIKENMFIMQEIKVKYEEIEDFILSFEKLAKELNLSNDFAKFGKW